MHSDQHTIRAEFKVSYDFPVLFSRNCFHADNPTLAAALSKNFIQTSSLVVYIDSGLSVAQPQLAEQVEHYCKAFSKHLNLLTQPVALVGGEGCKQLSQVQALYQHMLSINLDRHNFVLAIGGGAFLDMVGFAATTFHRGVKLLRMPSTVLAQNDAGIGVKNGYNEQGVKNLIGTFAPPFAVINDSALLESLAKRDRIAGHAEAVKVAAIRDADFFTWLENNALALFDLEEHATQYAIKRCAELHLKQITQAGDPFESGNARPLDYGHWSAHKLEALSRYDLRHGEAVAIGMALDALYASHIGLLPQSEAQRLIDVLKTLGFSLWHSALEIKSPNGEPAVLQGLEEFRQHLGGELCITLLQSIGHGIEVNTVDTNTVIQAIHQLRQIAVT